jgi:hypothetical protein
MQRISTQASFGANETSNRLQEESAMLCAEREHITQPHHRALVFAVLQLDVLQVNCLPYNRVLFVVRDEPARTYDQIPADCTIPLDFTKTYT